MRLTPRTASHRHSPIGDAHALLDGRSGTRPLIDASQAAPTHPPAPAVVQRIAEVAASAGGAGYCPQQGLPHLLDAFAADLRRDHGTVGPDPEHVLVTAGCNQAFCLAASALAGHGGSIGLFAPYYFNHEMWLQMDGIEAVLHPTDADLLPDVDRLGATLVPNQAAITVVSPGNPTGAEISAERLLELFRWCRDHDLVMILDETYRRFRRAQGPSHRLYDEPGWADHLITLHSFSKDLALPGYRVGAAVGHPDLLAEMMKLLDCVAICAPRISQEAAATGLTAADEWRVETALTARRRLDAFAEMMAGRPGGFELVSSGGYFGWVRHPYDTATDEVVRALVERMDVLTIPGHAFTTTDESMIRMSCVNLDEQQIDELGRRLAALGPLG